MIVTSPEGVPRSQESLGDTLIRHASEQFRSGIYGAWIELVDRYFGGENPDEQDKLSTFARSEAPLVASIHRHGDKRYPGVNAYFLVKIDPHTHRRLTYGPYGTEPIIVGHVHDDGTIIVNDDLPRVETYTDEQVKLVVRQAHELEGFGISMDSNSMRAPGFLV